MPAGDPVLAYRCYDLQTCDPLSILPFSKVSFGQTVSADDTFTGDLVLSDPRFLKLNWERATRPNCAAIFVDNDSPSGFAPWGGYVTGRKYSSKSKTMTVTATTFGAYMKQRLQAQDYTSPPSHPYWTANPADPAAIAAQVVYDALVQSLTMVSLSASECNICTGVQLMVNGAPPPSVTGCTPYSILQSGSPTVYCFGRNTCAVNGSDIDDSGTVIPASTHLVGPASVQFSGPATPNGATIASYTTGNAILHGVTSPYPIGVGMLADCPDFAIGTTVIAHSVGYFSGGVWNYATVTLSASCSSGHTSVNGTIGGWFIVTMSHNATGLAREDVNIANGNPSGLTLIDGMFAKSQYQTVDAIYTSLAQMGYGTGFDYSWDCAFEPGTKTPTITFNIETPRKGRYPWPNSGVVIDLEQATEWDYTEDGTSQVIGMVESSTGAGGNVSSIVSDSGLVTGDSYIPVEGTTSHTQILSPGQLDALAVADQAAVVWPVATMTVTYPLIIHEPPAGEPNPPGIRLGMLNTGDDVLVVINEGNLAVAGLPRDPRFNQGLSFVFELQSWKVTIPDSGVPTVLLTLGIPPSASLPTRPPLY